MANKITLTRTNQYIETQATVKITGTNLKNKYLFIELADKKHWVENPTFTTRVATVKITNDTTFTYTFIPNQNSLNTVYQNTPNTDALRMNIFVSSSYSTDPLINYSFISYIQPAQPIITGTPVYEVIDAKSLSLTNDNKKIIVGESTVKISGFTATAQKNGTIKNININDQLYSYESYVNNNYTLIIPNIKFKYSAGLIFQGVVDSRGWSSKKEDKKVLCSFGKIMSYHYPILKDVNIERDGISETTKLYIRGVYTEGYELGINPLNFIYKYQKITSDGSGTIELGPTQLTIRKMATTEWQNYQAILEEYNNPHYIEEEIQGDYHPDTDTFDIYTVSYYTKQKFENDINNLFEVAIKYNNKYTQEYLEKDYSSTNERYYCLRGEYGENGSWRAFWEDTLKEIHKAMYGSYISGNKDEDYGNGGNYEFEIESSAIKGDIETGFTLEKSFNIWAKISDEISFNEQKRILPTAIPAIDVYKDKVALHGLYDEALGGTQINGDLFLNGKLLDFSVKKGTFTINSSYFSTIDQNSYVKWGNVVYITFRALCSANMPNNTPIIELPYLSALDTELTGFSGTQYTSNTPVWCAITLSKPKKVIVGTGMTLGSGKWLHLQFMYITNEA